MQNIVKHDPGRARQNSEGTAGTNLTQPGEGHLVNICAYNSYLAPFLAVPGAGAAADRRQDP